MEMNQVKFAKVVEAAKAKSAGHPEWLRAVEKAAAAILSGKMIVTILAHGALVTTEGGTYEANGACNCAARTKHCYHRAGARLMAIYEAEPETNLAPGPARYCGDRDLQHLDACRPHIERTVEREFNAKTGKVGKQLRVVRCNNWPV